MNKYILILTSFIIGLSVSGQCLQSTMNTDILYRGFKNKIDLKDCKDVVTIVSNECSISKQDGDFIVKTGNSNSAVLHVLSSLGDTLNSKTYRVLNLPTPTVFLSGVASGQSANKGSGIVQVKYGAGIPIKESFEVKSWELRMNDAVVKGKGVQLNENAKVVLRSGSRGDTVTIITTVVCADSIARKIGGTWTLN
ncbi:MAG: hypothetical protein ACO2Z9_05660 [Crocinitomicaceae bacterium]